LTLVTLLPISVAARANSDSRRPLYEDVRAFLYKLLRRRQTDATVATSDERNFSIKLAHLFLRNLYRFVDFNDTNVPSPLLILRS